MSATITTGGPERLWSVDETSFYLGLKKSTLYAWRVRGIGPPAAKAGRMLRYDPADVRAWVRTQRR